MTRGRARVVGAGVIGLTTARCLADDGWVVDVVAAEPPADTTSAVAAAVWYPYLVGPVDDVAAWGAVARRRFDELARDEGAPVRRRTLHERFRRRDVAAGWRTAMPEARREEPPPPFGDAWSFTTWVVDMPAYLPWLVADLDHRGIGITRGVLDDLETARAQVDLVVDCAGIGARRLVPDPSVTAVGGQVVIVRAPRISDVWLDPDHPDGPTYVIPRSDTVVVGGTAVDDAPAGASADPAVSTILLRRAVELVPSLVDAQVVGHAFGRRPARPDVRLELEQRAWGPVLHHYGHGGAGVTLSWGSAAAATILARTVGGR